MELIEIITQHSLYRKTSGGEGMTYEKGETVGKRLKGRVFFEEKLSELRLGNVELESCIFLETDFYRISWDLVTISNCQFIRCDFSRAEMFGPVFENCIFDCCRFRSAEILAPELVNCIFINPDFINLILNGKMKNCILSGIMEGEKQISDEVEKENVIWIPKN